MKNFRVLLLCVLFSTIHYRENSAAQNIQNSAVQDFDAKLNLLQQTITTLITQSGLDPEVAQSILNTTNNLNQQAQTNIQQDMAEINVAAGLSSLLETASQMSQTMNQTDLYNTFNFLKFPVHANVIHTLLLGAYGGDRSQEPNYTNPYIESTGFIFNDIVFAALFQTLLTAITPTTIGKALLPNTTPQINNWIAQIAAGIIAHYAWILQKKLAFQQYKTRSKKHQ